MSDNDFIKLINHWGEPLVIRRSMVTRVGIGKQKQTIIYMSDREYPFDVKENIDEVMRLLNE